jgi:plastocyanin
MRHAITSFSVAVLVVTAAAWPTGRTASAGGACRGQPVNDEASDAVIMTANCFVPTIIRIDEGATVTWFSHDNASHTVTGANASWGSFEEVPEGAQHSEVFDRAGVYPYYCFLHPGMIGAVVVGDGGGGGAAGGSVAGADSDRSMSLVLGAPAAFAGAVAVSAGAVALLRRRRRHRARP